jgi:Amino acid permease
MATTGRSESRLFVRNSTGLVRSASAVDATIFNAVISAPIGSTLAWSIFFTLVAFPGADPVGVLIIAAVINIPVLIMFALLGASMPRVGGDYVWVSRILNPPLALISNLCMIMGGLARRGLLRQVLLGLRARPGAGRRRQPGPLQHVRARRGINVSFVYRELPPE